MMNTLKSVIYLSMRGYRAHAQKPERKGRSQLRKKVNKSMPHLSEEQLYANQAELVFEEDENDPDRMEGDFTHVHRSFKDHEREMAIQHDKLKLRILKSKYFKEKEPNFLTWSEKEQIRSLHQENSTEWNPQSLSECFPALPETIQKILKADWKPKNVETVCRYDETVVKNWKDFKAGKLALNPQLSEHLNNFKGRKIDVRDLKNMAKKFVEQEVVFPKPTASLFSSMVKDSVIKVEKKEEKILAITDKKKEKITNIKNKEMIGQDKINYKKINQKHVTFDSFLQNSVDKLTDKKNLSLENQLLVEEYKKRKNDETLEQAISRKPTEIFTEADTNEKLPSTELFHSNLEKKNYGKFKIDENSMATGIIEWTKKELTVEEDYPAFIKVPRAKAKLGVTFRVQDRYYDSDGEFLYRVPALKT